MVSCASQELFSAIMLAIIQDLVFIKMSHNIGGKYVFKYFTKYVCEGYGPVICRIRLSPFFVSG